MLPFFSGFFKKKDIPKEYLNIKNLEADSLDKDKDESVRLAKSKSRILVIDDENFAPLHNLKRHQFKIFHMEDLERIDDVEDYNIILIDIQGVGRGFDNIYQGSHLIRQIKKLYPEKYVIAYTGGASQELTSMASEFSDKYVPKDISIDKWCDVLEDASLIVSNPIHAWKNFRYRLLENGISPFQLTVLEDTYVRSIVSHSSDISNNMLNAAEKVKVSSEITKIISSVISGVITKEITKYIEG